MEWPPEKRQLTHHGIATYNPRSLELTYLYTADVRTEPAYFMESFVKTSSLVPVSLRMRLFAWLNIAVQAAFPLAVAFTPAVAGTAGSDGRFLHEQAVSAMQTRVYTLGEGESVSSVARKYNMSVDSLRKLNQFRTFAHGFDHLQAGDELDVPVAPLPEVRWDDTPSGAVSDKKEKEDDAQTKVAGYASQAGNFISASTRSDAAASMARGMASGAASGEIVVDQ